VVACTPHTGIGTVAYMRATTEHVLELGTCRDRVVAGRVPQRPRGLASPDGRYTARVVTVHAKGAARGSMTIVVHDGSTGTTRAVHRVAERYAGFPAGAPGPIGLLGWSQDSRWIFFFVDPMGSASILADGAIVRVVPLSGGRVHVLGTMLPYPGYSTWCGGKLVLTMGGDRISMRNKRLVTTGPPDWKLTPLTHDRKRSWSATACTPDGRSLVAESQPSVPPNDNLKPSWSLWRIGLDGTMTRLTRPPRGLSDESPAISRDGRSILFVRERDGRGSLYVLRDRRLIGPLLALPPRVEYFGYTDWWQSMTWSLALRR
jgi:WD40-like Beta Propeller Repeat